MNATHFLTSLALVLSLASTAFALDATQAVRRDITPKSPVPTGTVATWPMDAAVPPGWLACNGQAVPSSYPELRALMGSVPNYNNRQFLRGATSGAGSSVTDSTRSHTHVVPAHSHTVSGTAAGQSVSVGSQNITGTAAGQSYVDSGITWETHFYAAENATLVSSGVIRASHITPNTVTRTTSSSSISGRTSGGTYTTSGGSITGVTNSVSQSTESTGGSETAPMHTLVKYIIKAD